MKYEEYLSSFNAWKPDQLIYVLLTWFMQNREWQSSDDFQAIQRLWQVKVEDFIKLQIDDDTIVLQQNMEDYLSDKIFTDSSLVHVNYKLIISNFRDYCKMMNYLPNDSLNDPIEQFDNTNSNIFKHMNGLWNIQYNCKLVLIPKGKGLSYINYLISHQNSTIYASEIYNAINKLHHHEVNPEFNDIDNVQLRAKGMRLCHGNEKSRQSVSKAIRDAIEKIADAEKQSHGTTDISKHLYNSIKFGTRLGYLPEKKVTWDV